MQRITHPDIDQAVQQCRIDRAPGVIDDRRDIVDRDVVAYYLDPVSGQHVPSILQIDDDVNVGGTLNPDTQEVEGGMNLRVVGPAQGREWFAAVGWMMPEDTWPTMGVFQITQITDRAPADPNEPGPHFPVIPTSSP